MKNPLDKFRLGKKAAEGYLPEYVGKIRYCSYWGKFSLIINIDKRITEIDGFGETNNGLSHKVRAHCTALDSKDAILTVEEFYTLNKELLGW